MEKVLQPYDKERMRMAMLKHEEIFRQQVYELHRLYKIQRMLMDDEQQRPGKKTHTKIVECNDNNMVTEDHESELELTLSLGPSIRRKTDKSESGQSTVSSSSTGSTQTRKTSPKDVNSSGLNTENSVNQFVRWGSGGGNFPQGTGSRSGFEAGFSNGQQSNSHPAWLFQALSLKLT